MVSDVNRVAILIESSNVRGQNDLPGAREDLRNWLSYLQSDLGGKWSSSEIISLSKPDLLTVSTLLRMHRDKYCFVIFSGHGFFDATRKVTKICLNDSQQDVAIDGIKPIGSRGCLIVDACRGVERERKVALTLESHRVYDSASSFSEAIIKSAQDNSAAALWLRSLANSSIGVVTMYSCAIGQSAGEFPKENLTQGGYFTTSLMLAANRWADSARNSVLDTKGAFDGACYILKTLAPQQSPEYSPVSVKFPFAVAL